MTRNSDPNQFVQELLHADPFEELTPARHDLFVQAVMYEAYHSLNANPSYRRFVLNRLNGDSPTSLSQIPGLPVQVFKEIGLNLSNSEGSEKTFTMQSSATSGNPSSIVVDRTTASRQSRAMASVVKAIIGSKRRPMLVVDWDPSDHDRSMLGARYAATIGYTKFASSTEFLLTSAPGGGMQVRDEALDWLRTQERTGTDVVLFGFTYMVKKYLLDDLQSRGMKFAMSSRSQCIHIGGWKRLESEKVTPNSFKELLRIQLGLKSHQVTDIYGFTEQMGLNYPECSNGWKHVPVFAQVRVLNPITLDPQASGEEGLLEFTTPIPHSYPGLKVITDDVGVLNANEQCGCGWYGPTFVVTGRRKRAEIRGCGDILAESLHPMPLGNSVPVEGLGLVISSRRVCLDSARESGVEMLRDELARLNEAGSQLRSLKTQEILSAIAELRKVWVQIAGDPSYLDLRRNGLAFLIQWSEPERLRQMLQSGIRGGGAALEGFAPLEGTQRKHVRAVPRGLIAQWVSGNVPLLAVFPIIQGWLTRNPSISRLSSRSQGYVELILKPLAEQSGCSDVLKMLADATTLVTFDKFNTDLNSMMSKAAKTRIAWGGADAVRDLSALPRDPEARDLMFGPRTSFAVAHQAFFENDRSLARFARRLAADIFVFNQAACASPHTLFLKADDEVFVDTLREAIMIEMAKLTTSFGAAEIDEELVAQVRLARTIADFSGHAYGPEDCSYTVLIKRSEILSPPTFGRTLIINRIGDLSEILTRIPAEVQTVGIALPRGIKWEFAEHAAQAGVLRFTEVGSMTEFDDPWDGLFVLDEFVTYASLA